jgi:hypothetical protein
MSRRSSDLAMTYLVAILMVRSSGEVLRGSSVLSLWFGVSLLGSYWSNTDRLSVEVYV